MKEIGLSGPRIQKAYADRGVLGFDVDFDALSTHDERLGDEFDRRRAEVDRVAATAEDADRGAGSDRGRLRSPTLAISRHDGPASTAPQWRQMARRGSRDARYVRPSSDGSAGQAEDRCEWRTPERPGETIRPREGTT